MIPIDTIANFFDEIDDAHLVQFNWKPKESIARTYTIKDRFKIKFKGMTCIYDNIEDCRIKFHIIFHDNIHYVFQCRRLMEKIQNITDADKYEFTIENSSAGGGSSKGGSIGGSNNTIIGIGNDKSGALSGSGDATTLGSLWEEDSKAIITKNLLNKKADAIMEFLDPNLRQLSQTFNTSTGNDGRLSSDVTYGNSWSMALSNNKSVVKRKVEAQNELIAINVKLPKIIDEFLECFNVLFYY